MKVSKHFVEKKIRIRCSSGKYCKQMAMDIWIKRENHNNNKICDSKGT